MKNFLFSTTRQWNCGDEFILHGINNILRQHYGNDSSYNQIIYNRNPSIRHVFHSLPPPDLFKKIFFKYIPEYDNSYHKRIPSSFIDIAFCAGTPEWYGKRMIDFYQLIKQNNTPFVGLGLGAVGKFKTEPEKSIIKNAKILTFRTPNLVNQAKRQGLTQALYLPCPALLSAKQGSEKKNIETIKTIGLGFNVNNRLTAPHIGLSDNTFDYMNKIFDSFIKKYNHKYKILGICHYIDELPYAIHFFEKYGIEVRYSYDSNEYYSIYKELDCLISSRVHGCGISSSLGIPSIGISHDNRGETIKGFMARMITPNDSFSKLDSEFIHILNNSSAINSSLLQHKKQTLNNYLELIETHLKNYL